VVYNLAGQPVRTLLDGAFCQQAARLYIGIAATSTGIRSLRVCTCWGGRGKAKLSCEKLPYCA